MILPFVEMLNIEAANWPETENKGICGRRDRGRTAGGGRSRSVRMSQLSTSSHAGD
jgi:hypothetical protein